MLRTKSTRGRSLARRCAAMMFVISLVAFFVLSRLPNAASAESGDLDGTFGAGGIVTTDFFGADDEASAVAIQADGKIVAAGYALDPSTGHHVFALARYNIDGGLDDGTASDITPGDQFGIAGKVTTDFAGAGASATAMALQPDGKIIAAGLAINTMGIDDFALARYNTDGSLDTSFGPNRTGKVTTDFGGYDLATSLLIQTDGRIIVGGQASGSGFVGNCALARYNADGNLDSSFGANHDGKALVDLGGQDAISALVLTSDGRIIAAGSNSNADFTNFNFALLRFTPNGLLDSTFGSSGIVITDFSGGNDFASAMTIQADDKIVVAGLAPGFAPNEFALARYRSDGALDTSFGPNGTGLLITDFTAHNSSASAVRIRSINGTDSILAVGTTDNLRPSPLGDLSEDSDIALSLYSLSGDLVPSFGPNHDGKVITDIYQGAGFFHGDDAGKALAIQADSKIVVAGSATRFQAPGLEGPRQKDFVITRYISSIAGPLCSITCPSDITVGNDPGQNGAIVNYPAPVANSECGVVSCTRPSGSFFPLGATPVSCTTGAGPRR